MAVLFRIADVIDQHAHVSAEEVELGKYTFLPHHRTGAAAGLRNAFSTESLARATLSITVPVTAGPAMVPAKATLRLRGPGDVLTVDPRQIIRRYPEPGVPDAEPSDLAHVEFDTPDLPWQFTPAGPDARGHLPSWLRLIVTRADQSNVRDGSAPGLPQTITVPKGELPPPADVWAWAHVQVLGPSAGVPTLPDRLSGSSPTTNVSRLVCPRKLDPNQSWIAAVVPVFDVGRLAGLGLPVADNATLGWAWGSLPDDLVTLPAYDVWRFATGDDGDFETLAERLLPVAPPPGVGRRAVDTSRPGMGIAPLLGEAVRQVSGPLVRVGDPTTDGLSWPAPMTDALRLRVDAPDRVAYASGEAADPTVGPPVYGGAHLARRTVPDTGTEPAWARTLNLDPADRLVAGLGTRVVQNDQEDLMTAAWAQVEGVVAANAALSAAALGRFVGESLHRRHLGRMHAADLVSATARSHSRILDTPGQTVAARIGASALAPAAVGPLLRRVASAAGPLARRAGSSAMDRVTATRSLVTDGAGGARSWVRQYEEPDGVRVVRQSTVRTLLEVLAAEADLIAAAQDQIAQSAFVSTVGGRRVEVGELARDLGRATAADELRRTLEALLAELPTRAEIESDPRMAAPLLPDLAGQILAVIELGFGLHLDRWSLAEQVVRRLDLGGEPDATKPGRVIVAAADIREMIFVLWRFAREFVDLAELTISQVVVDQLGPLLRAEDGALAEDLVALQDGLAVDTPRFGDVEREAFAITDLGLLERLDPRVTAVRRIEARLTTRPAWLPADWFDDTRLERVMVAPRFRHPMYEALDRYDHEWLLPGVGAIAPQEMVTLLSTNPRFVESFLIGLNTEMARELLWREYPTDGRATSFRSFWTTNDELLAEVHALGSGELGAHIDPTYAAATVLLVRGELVRRYPDLLAHAVQQTADGLPPAFERNPATTLFRLHLAPDLLLVGVDVKSAVVTDADRPIDGELPLAPPRGAWWFVLSEHVGQPRFGLDEEGVLGGQPRLRDDLAWADWALVPPGPFLSPEGPMVAVIDRPGQVDAASLAWLLFQQPHRAAFRGARMIAGMS